MAHQVIRTLYISGHYTGPDSKIMEHSLKQNLVITSGQKKKEILLPYKQSTLGPFISKGDINGDGYQDLIQSTDAMNKLREVCKNQKVISIEIKS